MTQQLLGGLYFFKLFFFSFFGVILRLLFIRSNAVSGCQRVSDCLLGAIPEHNLTSHVIMYMLVMMLRHKELTITVNLSGNSKVALPVEKLYLGPDHVKDPSPYLWGRLLSKTYRNENTKLTRWLSGYTRECISLGLVEAAVGVP